MRKIPVELTKRYEAEGWWTQDTLGDLVAEGLRANPDTGFVVLRLFGPSRAHSVTSSLTRAGSRRGCTPAASGLQT